MTAGEISVDFYIRKEPDDLDLESQLRIMMMTYVTAKIDLPLHFKSHCIKAKFIKLFSISHSKC
jgi:hypothetical protein